MHPYWISYYCKAAVFNLPIVTLPHVANEAAHSLAGWTLTHRVNGILHIHEIDYVEISVLNSEAASHRDSLVHD